MNLGDLYWHFLKDIEQAEWAYLEALEREPSLTRGYWNLAELYRYSIEEKKEMATDVLLLGVENNPDDRAELYALAASWAREDDRIDDAITYYEAFLKLDPSHEQARLDLESLYKKR
jgi:cytochrome c-type biogenesis protein CcmH/NrfG